MKEKLTPRWFIIKLTGILFAIYSAYNIFKNPDLQTVFSNSIITP